VVDERVDFGPVRDVMVLSALFGLRTFKPRLADEDTRYRSLLDDELSRRALELLPSELTLAQIASRLGYTTTGAFERAFRRWTGLTPAAYRRAHGW
jgi:AraC-like DNA-binding protein